MSPPTPPGPLHPRGFPRVSGDEPRKRSEAILGQMFSPRERG